MRTVVLGNGGRRRGSPSITPACLELVRETERMVARRRVEVVVLTGGSRGAGPSEAEQMRAAWQGPAVEFLVEPTAWTTSENAARTLPLLLAREIERAVVVCAPLHLFRTRFFFSRLFEPCGIRTAFHVARASGESKLRGGKAVKVVLTVAATLAAAKWLQARKQR